jgi:hypothetical protein
MVLSQGLLSSKSERIIKNILSEHVLEVETSLEGAYFCRKEANGDISQSFLSHYNFLGNLRENNAGVLRVLLIVFKARSDCDISST